MTALRLHPDDLAALIEGTARRAVELLREEIASPTSGELLTAAQVARRFGVDRSWVYAHADELGAARLGGGSKPRLRFNPVQVAAALSPAPEPAAPIRTTPLPAPRAELASLPPGWLEAMEEPTTRREGR